MEEVHKAETKVITVQLPEHKSLNREGIIKTSKRKAGMESQGQRKGSDFWVHQVQTVPKEKHVQNWTIAYYTETVSKKLN